MKKSFEIESDCLDIIKRIKQIDNAYYVVYDIEKQSYELHNKEQKRNSYCLTLPFETLDERSYLYVLKTRVQNSDALFKEMEEENIKNRERQIREVLNDFEEKIYDSKRYNYAGK